MDEENKKTNSTSDKNENIDTTEVKNVPNTEVTNTEVKKEEKVESNPVETKDKVKAKKTKSEKNVQTEKPKKKKKVGLIVSIVVVVLAIIAGAIGGAVYALVFARTEIDLAKYVSVEFDGYDGYASFDEDDLIIDEKGLKKLLESKSLATKLSEKLLDRVEVEDNENLKNGDEFKVKFKVSESWLKERKIKFTSNTIKIKVKDLKEPNSLDLFEDLEFSYSGVSPDLTLSLKNNSKNNFIKNNVSFTMETEDNAESSYSLYDVANGDKITVTATYSQSDLEEAGYVVDEDEFEFTIKGQAEYITSSDKITEDIKTTINEKMLSKAKDVAEYADYDVTEAYSEDFDDISHYDYNLSHADPVLVKTYIAINNDLEDMGYSDSRNIVYNIYKITFTDSTTSKTYDYYTAIEVSDLVTDSEGLYNSKNYYYSEFDNYYFEAADGKDYHRSADELYNAINDEISEDYTLTEVK